MILDAQPVSLLFSHTSLLEAKNQILYRPEQRRQCDGAMREAGSKVQHFQHPSVQDYLHSIIFPLYHHSVYNIASSSPWPSLRIQILRDRRGSYHSEFLSKKRSSTVGTAAGKIRCPDRSAIQRSLMDRDMMDDKSSSFT